MATMNFNEPSNVDSLIARACRGFESCFERKPRWAVIAPGRVNIIGEHTDYNSGFALPMAIERYVAVAGDFTVELQQINNNLFRLHSSAFEQTVHVNLDDTKRRDSDQEKWTNYVVGVVAEFQKAGTNCPPLDLYFDSNLPMGAGLSSSAAMEVATATIVELTTDTKLDGKQKAKLCQSAEHNAAGVPCGIMDQFASVLSKKNNLMLLDCQSEQATMIPFPNSDAVFLIINSQVKHQLANSAYLERRKECAAAAKELGVKSLREASMKDIGASELDTILSRRAEHVVSENARTLQMTDLVQKASWKDAGQLMYDSHRSLKLDFEVSCPELDILVEIANEIGTAGGVWGARMTGGGFGGCTVSLVNSEDAARIGNSICQAYEIETGIQTTFFVSQPEDGARVVDIPSSG